MSTLTKAVRDSARRLDLAATLAWLDADVLMHTPLPAERATVSAALLIARADLEQSHRQFRKSLGLLLSREARGTAVPRRATCMGYAQFHLAGFARGGRQSTVEYYGIVWDSIESTGEGDLRANGSDAVLTLAEAVRRAEQTEDQMVDARQTASLAFAGILSSGELDGIRYVPSAFGWFEGAFRLTESGSRFAAQGEVEGSGRRRALTLNQVRSAAGCLFPGLGGVDGIQSAGRLAPKRAELAKSSPSVEDAVIES